MGIYTEGEHTLIRARTKEGLYVQVQRNRIVRGTVHTSEPDKVQHALNLGRLQAVGNTTGTWASKEHVGYTVAVGYAENQLRVCVTDAAGVSVALVDAEYVLLASQLLARDPQQTYEPVRHVVVQAGQVMLRRHNQDEATRRHRRMGALSRLKAKGVELALVSNLMQLIGGNDNDT